MRVDVRPRKRNSPRPASKNAKGFLQWLRGRPCACGGILDCCEGRMVAAHVDHGGDKGMGTKVSDRFAIPLTDGCHRWQHMVGWRTFERMLPGRDAIALSESYWRNWPGRAAWEAKNG